MKSFFRRTIVIFLLFLILALVLIFSLVYLRKNNQIPSNERSDGFEFKRVQEHLSDTINATSISSLDDEEFLCYGSCYCENERRNSIASRTVYRILTASSLVFAYQIARKQIYEECSSLIPECEPDGTRLGTELEECLRLIKNTRDRDLEGTSDTEPGEKKYICEGSCVPTLESKKDLEAGRIETNGLKCEDLKRKSAIYVKNEIDYLDEIMGKNMKSPYMRFIISIMMQFCFDNSLVKINYDFEDPETGLMTTKSIETYMCYGGQPFLEHNVKCTEVEKNDGT